MTVAGIGESFAGVLEELAFDNGIGRTGCLYVMAHDERHAGRIYLVEGQVYAIHVDGFRPRFIQRMFVGGYISEAQRDDLIARCGGPYSENAGTVAMETGLVDKTLVEIMYREMLLSAAGAMASWGPLRTIFEPNEQTQAFAVRPLSVRALNTAVGKRREKWNELWAAVCPTSAIESAFPRSLITHAEAVERDFPSEVAALTTVCDGRTRFDDVAGALGFTRFEAVVFMGQLLDAGVITFDSVPAAVGTMPPLNETLEFSDALPDGSHGVSYSTESLMAPGLVSDTPADAAAAASSMGGDSAIDHDVADGEAKGKKERRFFRRTKKKKGEEDDAPMLNGDDTVAPVVPVMPTAPIPVAEEVQMAAPELNPALVAPSAIPAHPVYQQADPHQVVGAPVEDPAAAPVDVVAEESVEVVAPVAEETEAIEIPAVPPMPQMPPVFGAPAHFDPLTAPAETVLPQADPLPMPVPPMPFHGGGNQEAYVPPVAAPANPFAVAAPAQDPAPVQVEDTLASEVEVQVEADPVADAVTVDAEASETVIVPSPEAAVLPEVSLPPLPPMPQPFVPSSSLSVEPLAADLPTEDLSSASAWTATEDGPVDLAQSSEDAVSEAAVEPERGSDDEHVVVDVEQDTEDLIMSEETVNPDETQGALGSLSLPPMPSFFLPPETELVEDPETATESDQASEQQVAAVVEAPQEASHVEASHAEVAEPVAVEFETEAEQDEAQQDEVEQVEDPVVDAVVDFIDGHVEVAEPVFDPEPDTTDAGFEADAPLSSESDVIDAEVALAASEALEQQDEALTDQEEQVTAEVPDLLGHARRTVDEAISAKEQALERREQAKQRLVDLETQVTEAVSMESNAYDEKAVCLEAAQMAKADLRSARDSAHAAEAARVAAADALREAQERYAHAEAVAADANHRVGDAERAVIDQADALNDAFSRLNTAARITAQARADLSLAASEAEVAEHSVKHCKDVLAAARDALETLEED